MKGIRIVIASCSVVGISRRTPGERSGDERIAGLLPEHREAGAVTAQGRGIPTEVRADFNNKNKSSCVIQPFDGVPNLRFISKSEERHILAAGTTEFDKKYGKGAEIVAVSRVGFNSDKTLALLHVLYSSSGELYLLEHKDGKWVIKFYVQTKAT